MSWNCENINIIEYKDKGKTTPVIEIESDDVSTNTHNLNYKDTEVEHINSIDNYLNWSHHVLRSSPYSDECSLICLLKIDDFRKFIDLKKQIELKGIEFYLQRFDLQLLMKVCFIPTDENFSIKIEFTEDKQFGKNRKYRTAKSKNSNQSNLNNFCLIPKNNSKNNKVGKINDEDSNDMFSNDGSSDESISTDFKNILKDNDIVLDIHLGIHSKLKNFFTKNKKEKLKLNLKREIIFEDFFQYDGLVFEKLIDPFIFRIKITTPSINIQKCDEHIGIINEGNTCYMNSVIQSLFHIKHLRKAIFNIPSAEESSIYAIQKVFYSLQNDKSSIKLLNLFKSLNWEKSFWNSQQDVQEIFSFIFNLLSDQEKNYLDSNAQLSDLCEGNLKSKINCIDIDFESEKDEKFLFLQLFIENSKSLIECIERFISVESLTGDNRYETEDKVKHEATRTFMFSKIPQILFVQLKRFKCQGAEIIKVHRKIEYPEQLNLADYYSTKVDELIYSLYAVVVQDGNMNSGHYFVFIRDFKKNIWLKFNDTKVTYASEEEVFQQNFGGTEENFEISNDGNIITFDSENLRTAYILIYVQKDRIEFLFQDLKKEDIPESLIDMLNSTKRLKNNQNSKIIESKILENPKDNFIQTSLKFNDTINSRTKRITAIKSDNFYGKNDIINKRKPGTKVKSQDRDSSVDHQISNEKIRNPTDLIHQILHNKDPLGSNFKNPENDQEFYIEIMNQESSSTFKASVSTNNIKVPPFYTESILKNRVKTDKSLIRKLCFKFIENKTNFVIEEVKYDKSLDKKIPALKLIEECHTKLKSQIDIQQIKLIVLNNMGLFIHFVDESEDVCGLLLDFHQKKIFLCFYIIEVDTVLNMLSGPFVSLHIMKKGFDEDNKTVNIHNKQDNLPKPPVIVVQEKMMNTEYDFTNCIKQAINEVFKELLFKSNEKNPEDTLSQITSYTQVKLTKTFGTFEFFRINKKEALNEKVIRLAVESRNIK